MRFEGRIAQRPLQSGEVLVQFDTGAEFPGRQNTAGFTELTTANDQITSARIHLNAAEFDWASDGSVHSEVKPWAHWLSKNSRLV